jgi:hypothetical protein
MWMRTSRRVHGASHPHDRIFLARSPLQAAEWIRPISHVLLIAWSLLTLATTPPRATVVDPSSTAGTRGWECVPGVIRGDGDDTFRLEVDVRGPARSVRLSGLSPLLLGPGDPVGLHDDGESPDVFAGDGVWTAGPFRFNPARDFPEHFADDPASPAGLYIARLGTVRIEGASGQTSEFLLPPSVGLLRPDVPAVPVSQRAGDVVVSRHLINLASTERVTQRAIRSLGADVAQLTRRLYAVLPDVFDFLFLFSGDKVERASRVAVENFTAGLHVQVRSCGGAATRTPSVDASRYGSAGRLLGVNLLDTGERGIAGNNATHELLHQWSSRIPGALNDGAGHYRCESSVGSLLGGFRWTDNGDGTFTRDGAEGRNGARHASPLDLYTMGLIPASAVPAQRVMLETSVERTPVIRSFRAATAMELRELGGSRAASTPCQRDFHIGFVIESNGRFLTETERTFYDRLAEHYAATLPAESPDPYVGANWPTIARFFGHGTTWTTDLVRMSGALSMRETREVRLPGPGGSRSSRSANGRAATPRGDRPSGS